MHSPESKISDMSNNSVSYCRDSSEQCDLSKTYLSDAISHNSFVLPRKPKRVRGRIVYKHYPKGALEEAVRLVLEEKMSSAEAASKCGVPKGTLYYRLTKGKVIRESQSEIKPNIEGFIPIRPKVNFSFTHQTTISDAVKHEVDALSLHNSAAATNLPVLSLTSSTEGPLNDLNPINSIGLDSSFSNLAAKSACHIQTDLNTACNGVTTEKDFCDEFESCKTNFPVDFLGGHSVWDSPPGCVTLANISDRLLRLIKEYKVSPERVKKNFRLPATYTFQDLKGSFREESERDIKFEDCNEGDNEYSVGMQLVNKAVDLVIKHNWKVTDASLAYDIPSKCVRRRAGMLQKDSTRNQEAHVKTATSLVFREKLSPKTAARLLSVDSWAVDCYIKKITDDNQVLKLSELNDDSNKLDALCSLVPASSSQCLSGENLMGKTNQGFLFVDATGRVVAVTPNLLLLKQVSSSLAAVTDDDSVGTSDLSDMQNLIQENEPSSSSVPNSGTRFADDNIGYLLDSSFSGSSSKPAKASILQLSTKQDDDFVNVSDFLECSLDDSKSLVSNKRGDIAQCETSEKASPAKSELDEESLQDYKQWQVERLECYRSLDATVSPYSESIPPSSDQHSPSELQLPKLLSSSELLGDLTDSVDGSSQHDFSVLNALLAERNKNQSLLTREGKPRKRPQYRCYTPAVLQEAINLVKKGVPQRVVCQVSGIPRTTLHDNIVKSGLDCIGDNLGLTEPDDSCSESLSSEFVENLSPDRSSVKLGRKRKACSRSYDDDVAANNNKNCKSHSRATHCGLEKKRKRNESGVRNDSLSLEHPQNFSTDSDKILQLFDKCQDLTRISLIRQLQDKRSLTSSGLTTEDDLMLSDFERYTLAESLMILLESKISQSALGKELSFGSLSLWSKLKQSLHASVKQSLGFDGEYYKKFNEKDQHRFHFAHSKSDATDIVSKNAINVHSYDEENNQKFCSDTRLSPVDQISLISPDKNFIVKDSSVDNEVSNFFDCNVANCSPNDDEILESAFICTQERLIDQNIAFEVSTESAITPSSSQNTVMEATDYFIEHYSRQNELKSTVNESNSVLNFSEHDRTAPLNSTASRFGISCSELSYSVRKRCFALVVEEGKRFERAVQQFLLLDNICRQGLVPDANERLKLSKSNVASDTQSVNNGAILIASDDDKLNDVILDSSVPCDRFHLRRSARLRSSEKKFPPSPSSAVPSALTRLAAHLSESPAAVHQEQDSTFPQQVLLSVLAHLYYPCDLTTETKSCESRFAAADSNNTLKAESCDITTESCRPLIAKSHNIASESYNVTSGESSESCNATDEKNCIGFAEPCTDCSDSPFTNLLSCSSKRLPASVCALNLNGTKNSNEDPIADTMECKLSSELNNMSPPSPHSDIESEFLACFQRVAENTGTAETIAETSCSENRDSSANFPASSDREINYHGSRGRVANCPAIRDKEASCPANGDTEAFYRVNNCLVPKCSANTDFEARRSAITDTDARCPANTDSETSCSANTDSEARCAAYGDSEANIPENSDEEVDCTDRDNDTNFLENNGREVNSSENRSLETSCFENCDREPNLAKRRDRGNKHTENVDSEANCAENRDTEANSAEKRDTKTNCAENRDTTVLRDTQNGDAEANGAESRCVMDDNGESSVTELSSSAHCAAENSTAEMRSCAADGMSVISFAYEGLSNLAHFTKAMVSTESVDGFLAAYVHKKA